MKLSFLVSFIYILGSGINITNLSENRRVFPSTLSTEKKQKKKPNFPSILYESLLKIDNNVDYHINEMGKFLEFLKKLREMKLERDDKKILKIINSHYGNQLFDLVSSKMSKKNIPKMFQCELTDSMFVHKGRRIGRNCSSLHDEFEILE